MSTRLLSPARKPSSAVPVTATLIGTIALQTATPPFATDMYTPAFPRVTSDLATSASMVGLTLTAFFLGYAAGQLVGGPWSDQRGRRMPLIIGGLVCLLAGIGCALAPSIWFMIPARVVQGIGGGIAAAVARAVVVDIAHGDLLAKLMSVLQALGGLAPMVAPVIGALVITVAGWRDVFWLLAGMGGLMVLSAVWFVPETLPTDRRRAGGLRQSVHGISEVLRVPSFAGYMLVSAFSGFTMMAYIANSSYVLQGMKGMAPIQFSLFFATTALTQVLLSIINARIVGRFRPHTLIGLGLGASAAAVTALTLGVLLWNTPLVLTCLGFLVVMASQAFICGNSAALSVTEVTRIAGAAAAVQGVAGALALALAAPLASSGGTTTALPMIAVMIVGVALSFASYAYATTHGRRTTLRTTGHL